MTDSTPINITWHQPDERSLGRDDSAWYTHQSSHDLVVTVSKGDREIDIFADGEMRVLVYERDHDPANPDIIRYCDRWKLHGITNDADIFQASEEGRIEWLNNSWFDLYATDQNVGDGGWLDCVEHSLTDAIEQATVLLSEDELWEAE